MQTFGLTLQLSLSAVIAQTFLDEARTEAQKEDASMFLKTMQAKFPEDDDQFMLAILKNAMRTTLRHRTLDFMAGSGVGGSVSPVQIISESITQPKGAVAEFAESDQVPVVAESAQLRRQVVADDLRADPPVNGYSQEQIEIMAAFPAKEQAQ